MPTLILRLAHTPHADDAVYDYVLSADGSTVAEHATQSLAQLPQPGKAGLEVVALVAARHLSWHKLRFPPGVLGRRGWRDADAPRVRAVLEGLLEERL